MNSPYPIIKKMRIKSKNEPESLRGNMEIAKILADQRKRPRRTIFQKTTLEINTSTEGETIEMKIERAYTNNEPITDTADIIYTDRADGVIPAYNPRTDRFDMAIELADQRSEVYEGMRKQNLDKRLKIVDNDEQKEGGAQSTDGTS